MIEASKEKYSTEIQAKGLVTDGGGAVHYAMLRNCNVTPTKGQEHIRTCKLMETANTTRVYASCCGTPLGIDGGSFTIIHPQLLKPNPNKDKNQMNFSAESLAPSYCVHIKSAPEGAAPIPKGVKAMDGPPFGLALQFLAYSMTGIFSKKTPGLLGGSKVEPTIGIDSIMIE